MAWDMGRQLYVWENPETGALFVWHEASQAWIPDKGSDLEDLDRAFELDAEEAQDVTHKAKKGNTADQEAAAEKLLESVAGENPSGEENKKKRKRAKKKKPNTSVYVKGLPKDVTMEEMMDFFKLAGVFARDPANDMKPKIKIYRDENGEVKGDGLVTYLKPLAVENALKILDGSDFRPPKKVFLQVEVPVFQDKPVNPKKPTGKVSKKQKKYNQEEEDLGWEEKERVHVVIKHLFEPNDGRGDIFFYDNLKNEITPELEKMGPIETLKIFERSPEGVVAVKYTAGWAAERCIEVMNGRFFDGRKLVAEFYDGYTNYFVPETDEEREERDKKWEKWLEGNEEYEERIAEEKKKREQEES
eukprot:TRINITY_DN4097_c0_g1_i1.p1 TRINITY_DN4097_c0_g1~~TRINITY_DN4097_c0_g1_i1.p1  ORF type:complete len:377 (-),score=118.48 TRINITY_DN4097_c0_g1_i1:121-1197(-)